MKAYAGRCANDVWKEAARDLLVASEGSVPSRLGETRETLHAFLKIIDPRQRWIVARMPALNPAFALAEVVWILAGRDDVKFLSYWFPAYPNYVGDEKQQYGAYGHRLRIDSGIDQLTRTYEALKANPSSRQAVLQIWSSKRDLPQPDGVPRSGDIPCNLVSCLKIRRDRLHWLQISRSGDVDRGLPHNLVQFTLLHELFAGWLGLEIGEYVHVVDSLHWYVTGSSRLGIDDKVIPAPNTDRYNHSFGESMRSFDILARRMDRLVAGAKPVDNLQLPNAFENIYRVVAADSERRRGRTDTAKQLIAACDNPAYMQLWDLWVRRVGWKGTSQRRRSAVPIVPRRTDQPSNLKSSDRAVFKSSPPFPK